MAEKSLQAHLTNNRPFQEQMGERMELFRAIMQRVDDGSEAHTEQASSPEKVFADKLAERGEALRSSFQHLVKLAVVYEQDVKAFLGQYKESDDDGSFEWNPPEWAKPAIDAYHQAPPSDLLEQVLMGKDQQ